MGLFFSSNQTEFELSEPQLTRWRHRLRGHRESYKVNTETHQIEHDVSHLHDMIVSLKDRMTTAFQLIEFGGALDAYVMLDDATPAEEPVEVRGLEWLVAEIERLKSRIVTLEE